METEITSLYPNFKDLDIKINKTYKTINFKGQDIKIAEYLPIDEKIALIDIALQKSMYNGMVHPLQLKKYYELGLVYMYTDVIFSDEDRADEAKLYDVLYCSNFINDVIKSIPAREIQTLAEMLKETKIAIEKHKVSAVGIIETLIEVLNNEVPNIMEQLSQLTPEQAKSTLEMIIKSSNIN
jgi:hypothetical protein